MPKTLFWVNRKLNWFQGVFSLVVLLSFPALSGERQWLDWCEDEQGLGWNFYCDPAYMMPLEKQAGKKEEKKEAFSLPSDPLEATKAIRERLDWLKARAVLDPAPQHVREYLAFQQQQLDRASAFSDQWRRVVWATPDLDYTLKRPTGTLAKQLWLDDRQAEIEKTLAKLSNRYGLFFFFAGEDCVACPAGASIVKEFAEDYSIPLQAVTLDGVGLETFPDAKTDRGEVKIMGIETSGAVLPITVLFDSKVNEVVRLGNGLLTHNELARRIFVQTQLALGEDY